MIKRLFTCAALAAAVCLSGNRAFADGLGLGDPAPPLTVSKIVKGEKIEKLEPGKIYVVEFWATWCGPCKVSIPHLTDLQKQHKDVTFIGVSILENDYDLVEPFVKEMGDKMDYVVAIDDVEKGERSGKMATNWFEAAGENGIPTSFIVNKEGRIAWIGHPMSMEKPLAQVIDGTYDIDAAIKERKLANERQEKLAALSQKYRAAMSKGPAEQLKVLDEAIADDPGLEEIVGMTRYNVLIQTGDQDKITKAARSLVEKFADNGEALNAIAWPLIDPDRKGKPSDEQIAVAVEASKKAVEATKGENAAIIDTLALATYLSGDKKAALKLQEEAIEKGGETLSPAQLSDMKDRLEKYRKEAEAAR